MVCRKSTLIPETFRRSLSLLTWDANAIVWTETETDLQTYLGRVTAPRGDLVYTGPKPLPFNPDQARNPKFMVPNILYYYDTYCIACRHPTYLYDKHPWCMKCMLVSGYWPCTGGPTAARCVHCADYSDIMLRRNYRAWLDLVDCTTTKPELASCLPSRLPRYISTQFDASWSMILRSYRDAGAPLDDYLAHRLVPAYNLYFNYRRPELVIPDDYVGNEDIARIANWSFPTPEEPIPSHAPPHTAESAGGASASATPAGAKQPPKTSSL